MTARPDNSAREIISRRKLAATREQIFNAIADPQQLALWWGPAGFMNEFHRFDFRAGGDWKFTMIGPDGAKYENESRFIEISPSRIVFEHFGAHHFVMTMTLEETAGKTTLTWTQLHDTPAEREAMMQFVPAANEQNFDRLQAHLDRKKMVKSENTGFVEETMVAAGTGKEFTVMRVFDAPRWLVWKALTDGERLARWWVPKAYSMRSLKFDLKPGGEFLYSMQTPDMKVQGRFSYHEISPQDRISWVATFSDEKGVAIPCVPKWPLEVFNTLTLSEKAGKTTLMLRAIAINCNEEERKAFEKDFGNITRGFKITLDQLEQYLPELARLS